MRARKATADDVAAICRVCADGVRDTHPGLWPPAQIERSIEVFYTEPGPREVLVFRREL